LSKIRDSFFIMCQLSSRGRELGLVGVACGDGGGGLSKKKAWCRGRCSGEGGSYYVSCAG